jgi:N-acyl-D-aspartate/D-glutamate deacylase
VLDLIIRGGDLIDGSGAPRRRADVGVQGDRVVAIGQLDTEATAVIDASGKVVTPGFIDVHTHFDAQVFWDGALTPSPFHGVTTALAGNCGFSIQPLSGDAGDAEYLLRMLARVEGMPVESLRLGVPWDWRSTDEYLAAVEPKLGINAAFMVGHSAIRRLVMGPEATKRAATSDEVAQMADALRRAFDAGALGFSSSWARTHNDADGEMVPSRYATAEELIALSAVAGEFPGTSLEFIPMIGVFDSWAVELMTNMSAAAQRPLNWNLLVGSLGQKEIDERLAPGDYARARGGEVVALTLPLPVTMRFNFASGFFLDSIPGWESAMKTSPDERMALFSDPTARAALNAAAQSETYPMRRLMSWEDHYIFDVAAPENAQYKGARIGDIAEQEGREAWDVLCDIAVADELRTSFGAATPVLSKEDWERRMAIVRDGRALLGGSDAGAHLDLLATFNYPTIILAEAVRRHGVLSLEEAVHHMTEEPAHLYGITDRGTVAEGSYADLVVLDPATVASHEVAMRYDLPGGAGRLYAESEGIDHVVVNGSPILKDGALLPSRTGTLLRSGRDTTESGR